MDKDFVENIEIELQNLERLIEEMDQIINKAKEEPDFIFIRAAGSIIHDFYCGVEKIFERIANNVNNIIPHGEDWHAKLLLQMAQTQSGRNAVIDSELLQKLKEYLRFRHLFRNIYGFELRWARINPLCLQLNDVFNELKTSIRKYLKS